MNSEARVARYQQDGAGAWEVRLKFRYTDFAERDQAKQADFRWDPAAKEWYHTGWSEDVARCTSEEWQKRFDALDPAPSPYTGPRRRRAPVSRDPVGAVVDDLQNRLNQANRRILELEGADLKRQAQQAANAGTYHATCPACGGDVFFTVKEVERV